jgi:uncharacterized oligopeptide transporter (OPT) family protein
MGDDQYVEMVRNLIERASANTITDATDLELCIREHDLVFGVWQEEGAPLGVGTSIIKGKGTLERIKRAVTEGVKITAVSCQNADEAEAMRQLYGDQPAQVLPFRNS